MIKALADPPIHGDYIPLLRLRSAIFRLRRNTASTSTRISAHKIDITEKQNTMPTETLAQQLETLDAELFTKVVTTTHASAGQAIADTLLTTQAPTLELAQAATAGLTSNVVAGAPVELQPLAALIAPVVISRLTESIFNWFVGQTGGSAAKAVAVSNENQNPNGGAQGGS